MRYDENVCFILYPPPLVLEKNVKKSWCDEELTPNSI